MSDGGRGHAVVIGGSIAGLTAARVLADHFERVSLVEGDRLAGASERPGVPQASHLHGLLLRGQQLLEERFPGLVEALLAQGAVRLEFGKDLVWHHFGGWKAEVPANRVTAVCMTRLLLEAEVRRRVRQVAQVAVLDGCEVRGLAADAARRRVTGVVLRRAGAEAEQTLEAELVVDASGRGSSAPRWLEQLGRPRVEESIVKVDVGYATRLFERPPDGTHKWKGMFVVGQPPGNARQGVMWPVEGGRWIVSLVGLLGDHPPADEDGWMRFAKDLPIPDLHDALAGAAPLSGVSVFKFPFHQRRHYERMADLPDGLVVLGDAHCSFSPSYGQGMTTAAIGARVLGEQLARRRDRSAGSPGLSRAFQKALARSSDGPWMAATGEDLRSPEVEGPRPFGHGFMQWYTAKLHTAATVDPEVALAFYRVMHMVASPAELMSPRVLWKVLRGPRVRV